MRWPWSKKEPKETPKVQPPERIRKARVEPWYEACQCHCGYTIPKGTYMPVICPRCGCKWIAEDVVVREEWEETRGEYTGIERNHRQVTWTECTHRGG